LQFSTTFVLENFPSSAFTFVNYNQSFVVTFLSPGLPEVTANMPAYNPAEHPAASQSIPISGYLTGSYYDPTHSGEGVMLEVGEYSATSRYIFITWYTYDDGGIPYWITGLGAFAPGDRSLSIPMQYTAGGGFAGNFGSDVNRQNWGTVTVDFPSCSVLHFSYQSVAGLPQDIPQGAGSKSWSRLTGINGLNCQ
jgi:hypothetical protein